MRPHSRVLGGGLLWRPGPFYGKVGVVFWLDIGHKEENSQNGDTAAVGRM